MIELDTERIECTEILFNPNLTGVDEPGVHRQLFNAVKRSDIFLQRELFQNIVLSGGTTLLENFKERLHKELDQMRVLVRVHAKR